MNPENINPYETRLVLFKHIAYTQEDVHQIMFKTLAHVSHMKSLHELLSMFPNQPCIRTSLGVYIYTHIHTYIELRYRILCLLRVCSHYPQHWPWLIHTLCAR